MTQAFKSVRTVQELTALAQQVKLNKTCLKQDGMLTRTRQELAARDAMLVASNQQLSQKDRQLGSSEQMLAAKHTDLMGFSRMLADRDLELIIARQQLAQQAQHVAALTHHQGDINSTPHKTAQHQDREEPAAKSSKSHHRLVQESFHEVGVCNVHMLQGHTTSSTTAY